MTIVDITALVGVVIASLSSVIVPWVLRRRQNRETEDSTELASWTSLTAALQRERDVLQQRVERIDAEYRAKMAALAQDYAVQQAEMTTQLIAARNRITALEAEVTQLYARLGRTAQ